MHDLEFVNMLNLRRDETPLRRLRRGTNSIVLSHEGKKMKDLQQLPQYLSPNTLTLPFEKKKSVVLSNNLFGGQDGDYLSIKRPFSAGSKTTIAKAINRSAGIKKRPSTASSKLGIYGNKSRLSSAFLGEGKISFNTRDSYCTTQYRKSIREPLVSENIRLKNKVYKDIESLIFPSPNYIEREQEPPNIDPDALSQMTRICFKQHKNALFFQKIKKKVTENAQIKIGLKSIDNTRKPMMDAMSQASKYFESHSKKQNELSAWRATCLKQIHNSKAVKYRWNSYSTSRNITRPTNYLDKSSIARSTKYQKQVPHC